MKETARFHSVLKTAKRVRANGLVLEMERKRATGTGGLLSLSNVAFENNDEHAVDAKVIIFGDSYCEYRTHLLTGMIAETFRSVEFFWSSSIDFDVVAASKPDFVISECAERFVRRVPDDTRNLKNLAESRLHAYLLEHNLSP